MDLDQQVARDSGGGLQARSCRAKIFADIVTIAIPIAA